MEKFIVVYKARIKQGIVKPAKSAYHQAKQKEKKKRCCLQGCAV
jgi:hypothetical protein